MIDRGFEECKKNKANFWGVYPIPNENRTAWNASFEQKLRICRSICYKDGELGVALAIPTGRKVKADNVEVKGSMFRSA